MTTEEEVIEMEQALPPAEKIFLGPFKPIKEIVADLSKEIPARFIKQRKQGGATLDYVEWHIAAQFLDLYASGWSWKIMHMTELNSGSLIVHGRLTIPCAEGKVSRDATGIEEADARMYGDVASNAVAMAFKRAAVLFGLGRGLYRKDK